MSGRKRKKERNRDNRKYKRTAENLGLETDRTGVAQVMTTTPVPGFSHTPVNGYDLGCDTFERCFGGRLNDNIINITVEHFNKSEIDRRSTNNNIPISMVVNTGSSGTIIENHLRSAASLKSLLLKHLNTKKIWKDLSIECIVEKGRIKKIMLIYNLFDDHWVVINMDISKKCVIISDSLSTEKKDGVRHLWNDAGMGIPKRCNSLNPSESV